MSTSKSAMQQRKLLETRIHAQLYDYLHLLRKLHPTTRDFDAVCKPDMFLKNNKAAFQHTIYYLLKTLNPGTIKQHIPSWPILSHKMDVEFRKEVRTYVNDLKRLYPDSDIPSVVTSHLISPGGFKFASLMLDITRLVVSEVLKNETGTEELLCIPTQIKKFKEHTSTAAGNIAKLTLHIEANTTCKLKLHHQRMEQYEMEADDISKKLLQSKTNIPKLQQALTCLQTQTQSQMGTNEITDANIDVLEATCEKIKELQDKFNHCLTVLKYIKGNDCYIDFEVSKLGKLETGVKLSPNLLEHFEMFHKTCGVKLFDVRRVSQGMVENKMEIIQRAAQKYEALLDTCNCMEEKQEIFLRDLMDACQGTEELSHTLRDTQTTPMFTTTNIMI